MSKDTLSSAQKLAFEQQVSLLAHAHTQALKFLIESHQPNKLTVNGCLSYFELAKAKLSETEFKEFLSHMKHCKEPNSDILDVLVKIDSLFQGHPELIQGFGMFLPPDLNLQMQTGSLSFLNALKKENDSSPENTQVEKTNQDPALKENTTEPAADVVAGPSHDQDTSDSLDKKDSNSSKGVDDDSALIFLCKVKERFRDESQVFDRFLGLLDSVRKDCLGDRNDVETEVFLEVCELFQNHNDLVEEFKMFVPNASFEPLEQALNDMSDQPSENTSDENQQSTSGAVDMPKFSYVNDPSIAPVYKFGSYEEHVFFDKVREAFGHREVFDNFLRCLLLYNEDVITRSELLKLATSFLGKFPDLLRQFKDMLGFNESGENIEIIPMRIITLENQRKQPEIGLDIDYSTGGRNGASYRALPKDFEQPKCSGRTPLCKEVLNDTWVSFPSWSEDSTFVTSCKTQYEEIIYRCEDERFELDMAITANAYTTQVLENVQKRINKMSAEEKSVFYLDDMLGGTSTVIHQKTLHRLYGDKTDELVEGLKRNPVVAVPIILKRLKVKEDEWKEKQIKFNEIWRTQIDHYYLKSLDHQGINFKQNDSKSFRPKSILNEMEMVYAEKKENKAFNSAHFLLEFKEMDVFQDAINLMLQYLKKLPGVYRDDRRRIELLVRSFIPDFFDAPRSTLIEEDIEAEEESREADEPMEVENEGEERSGQTSPTGSNRDDGSSDLDESNSNEENELSDETDKAFIEESDVFDKIDPLPLTNLPYTLFFVSKTWYIFFRQFHILCERLSRLLLESKRQDVPIKKEDDTEQDSKVPEQKYRPSYQELIEKLSILLSGGMDYAQFEEESRSLFGIHAFISFTMDKLVLNVVRQLQQVVTDDICKQSTALFIQHTKTISSVGFTSPVEASQIEYEYLRKVEKIMEDEKCFKIIWHKKDNTLAVHLIEQENEDGIPDPCDTEKWSDYLDAYVAEDSCSEDAFPEWSPLPVFLPRNLRRQMAYWKNKVAYVEKLWRTRQSSKFIKRNISMTARKRKALSLITPLLNKMSRRSTTQEGSVHSSCSRTGSVDGSECPVEDNPVIPDEPTSDAVDDTKDLDENSSEVKILQTIEEDSEKAELVLVDLSEDEMGVQEESVHDTDHVDEIKSEEVSLESPEFEVDVKTETLDTGSAYGNLDTIKEESMEVEDNSCSSVASGEKKYSCKETTDSCDGQISEENMVEHPFVFQDIGAEMDLTSRIDMAVETASRVIETIAVDDSKEEEEAAVSGRDEDKQEEETDAPDPANSVEMRSVMLRRKILRKPCDYSIRTRKNRTNQSYVKRRMKRGLIRGVQCNKGKRRKPTRSKSDLFDDPSFDYAYFSELPEDEKAPQLAFRHLIAADNVEVSFKQGSYKVFFVHNCTLFLYRKNALAVSREVHQAVSEIKSSNFNAWHRIWLDRYVTPGMLKSCNDWLLKSDQEKFKLVRINVSDCTKPPYIPYNKYKIRYYKTDLIEI